MTTTSLAMSDITSDTITRENAMEVRDVLKQEGQRLRWELDTTAQLDQRAEIYRRAAALLELELLVIERQPGRQRSKQSEIQDYRHERLLCAAAAEIEQYRAAASRPLPEPASILSELRTETVVEAVVAVYAAAAENGVPR